MEGRAVEDLKGKNTVKLFGKACCEYPLIAAKKSRYIKKIYVSTDCPKIKRISKNIKLILSIDQKNLRPLKLLEKMYTNLLMKKFWKVFHQKK